MPRYVPDLGTNLLLRLVNPLNKYPFPRNSLFKGCWLAGKQLSTFNGMGRLSGLGIYEQNWARVSTTR